MRLRTYNSRRKRLHCGKKEPTGEPFCYIVYGKRVTSPIIVNGWVVDYEVQWKEWKRPFPNYPEAIAHLTRIKLAIDEEDSEWADSTPCKIVEGCYTKPGKEVITKEVRLNDECDRPQERHFSSGLPRTIVDRVRELRQAGVPIQQAVATAQRGRMRSSGPTTSGSTATAMDIGGVRYKILSY